MRIDTVQLVRQAVGAGRRAYVLVNNRAEGNAPVTVQGLVELLCGEVSLNHRHTAENANIVARRIAHVIKFQLQVQVPTCFEDRLPPPLRSYENRLIDRHRLVLSGLLAEGQRQGDKSLWREP